MKKRLISIACVAALGAAMLAGCGNAAATDAASAGAEAVDAAQEAVSDAAPEASAPDQFEATEVTVFAAASLQTVLTDLIDQYNETQPNVTITPNYGSSGDLMTQIEEGATCDVFFSAAQKQMNQLQDEDALVVDGTRHNVVNNQVCVVTYKDSGTSVTGLENIADASSLALAAGSVPVGKYTRQALVNAGMIETDVEDVAEITTDQVSEALGGIEINECSDVSAVKNAVAEGSNEVGTVYKSDTYGFEDKLDILQIVGYDLTGDVIYPIAQIVNGEADELEAAAAQDFINFITSDEAKAVFESYYFDTDVTD